MLISYESIREIRKCILIEVIAVQGNTFTDLFNGTVCKPQSSLFFYNFSNSIPELRLSNATSCANSTARQILDCSIILSSCRSIVIYIILLNLK